MTGDVIHRLVGIVTPIFILHLHPLFDQGLQVFDGSFSASLESGAHFCYQTR
jgi:hypothetical protein